MSTGEVIHREHFADLEQQAYAARFGMWIFLATEILLFGGAIALFAGYQMEHPIAFRDGIAHNAKLLGSMNTAILLASSTLAALAVHALRAGMRRAASGFLAGTIALGAVFLVIKSVEYRRHFAEGIYPQPMGSTRPGIAEFWTLYYGMTGLHAIHVIIGIGVLTVLLRSIVRGRLGVVDEYRLSIGAIYWHLVDVIWIFLWPLFYLA